MLLPQLAPERLPEVARAADEAGLDELWLWEDCFLTSGVAAAAAVLAATRRVRVGVGVLPAPLRNVALTAMEIATLHRLFPGRVRIGVGHGVQDWMAQVGARVESPMTLLREYVTALRALLAGERVTVHGRYVHLEDVALAWPPPGPVRIHVGAVGPRTLRLSGAVADGTILTGGTTPAQVSDARQAVGGHRITVYLHAATGPDAAARLATEQIRWGYDSPEGRMVHGDAATIAEQAGHWARAGADSIVLQPTPDDPDPAAFVTFVARQVRARLDAARSDPAGQRAARQ
ncbi:LLM class flavin-dependent oxidoreductase [Actinoplanes oblitus]|uniref:LLM class flavin-dependent oxidoreductase n=1 Tax=Actinoplanes oblitus TaxID=3040509 RepID=A0ABY8WUS5_9ACTN|nr:LLM class flavin-dependent oxidoreductase [Actinoplanes oblitus]WIN00170.1 LLM class flavin-dependent oxidoreductase [Actinoplanes oblitus]